MRILERVYVCKGIRYDKAGDVNDTCKRYIKCAEMCALCMELQKC